MAARKSSHTTDTPTAGDREAAVVEAYKAGKKITAIEQEFGVGRSTLYHILRRSQVMPSRSRKQLDAASRDSALAGLHELIQHQDRLLAERMATIAERDETIAQRDSTIAALQRALVQPVGATKRRPAAS